MKPWTRTPTDWHRDPAVHAIAAALRIRPAEVVGLFLGIWSALPEHAPDGQLRAVLDSLLEEWAGWRGKPGRFAIEFRARVLDANGAWWLWWELNGAVLREKAQDAARAAERRRKLQEAKQAQLDLLTEQTAAAIAKSPPDRPPDHPADGPALRTNERTTTTGRARAQADGRPGQFPAAPLRFAPGHVPAVAVAPPWCAHCGAGVLEPVPGQRRPVQRHAVECPLREAPVALEVPA